MMKNASNIEQTELIWLDAQHEVSMDELAELSGFSLEELHLLVESGALIPNNQTENKLSDSWYFNSHCVVSIRTLLRLKHDFELEPNALSLMLVFLERIRILELKLREFDHTKVENKVK
jgi:chaperone modulatory protein CbpM